MSTVPHETHTIDAPPRRRWRAWCGAALAAVTLASCGLLGDDSPDGAAPPEAESAAPATGEEEPPVEEDSVVRVPSDTTGGEVPVEESADDPDPAAEDPSEAVVDDAEGDEEEGCRWESAQGSDLFGEYLMATVVCPIAAPGPSGAAPSADALGAPSGVAGGDLSADALGAPSGVDSGVGVAGAAPSVDAPGADPSGGFDPDAQAGAGAPEASEAEPETAEARFGWRCSVGEVGRAVPRGYYEFEHSGRLEVFASHGGPPATLQFVGAGPDGSRAEREAAVLYRFGSDPHPVVPTFEVVVEGIQLDDEIQSAVGNQRITYEGLWRNSAGRAPRDRAGVLAVLEDRDHGGRYDRDEWELFQEHARHADHLLFAPDSLVEPITAALVLDASGRLHTAVAGVYIDFEVAGWEEHVGPVLEACSFSTDQERLSDLLGIDLEARLREQELRNAAVEQAAAEAAEAAESDGDGDADGGESGGNESDGESDGDEAADNEAADGSEAEDAGN